MQHQAPSRYRYSIFALIVVIALVNYIDRGAIAYSAEQITSEYGFNLADWGAVLGYFGYGYMFGALVGGALGDRFGARRVWIVAGIVWSLLAICMIWAGDFGLAVLGGSALGGFATVRILFGFSEGPAYSIINKTMSTWAAPGERGFAVSVGLLSTPLGALLTAPVSVGLLLLTDSWRTMYIVLGVAGLLLIGLFIRMYTNRPEEHPKVNAAELALIREGREAPPATTSSNEEEVLPWWEFFRSRTLMFNTLGYFAFVYVNFMLLTWTPKYLQDQFHFKLSSLWYVGMIPWVGACFTVLLGGRISDWLYKRTGKLTIARSWFAVVSLLLTTLCFLLVSQAQSVVAVIALMTLGNALNALPNSVYWAVVIDTAPSRVGTYSGIMHFLANTGSVLAPTLAGILSVRYGYSAMFMATAVATAVGVFAMLMVRPGVGPKPRAIAAK